MTEENWRESQAIGRRLSSRVRHRRGSDGLRETARRIGLSPATLLRVERGNHLPSIPNFLLLCRWLETSPAEVREILGFEEKSCPSCGKSSSDG